MKRIYKWWGLSLSLLLFYLSLCLSCCDPSPQSSSSPDTVYDRTPDECIPEFYSSPLVFESLHKDIGLPDLIPTEFSPTPESFIQWHREKLEDDRVSAHLHEWIGERESERVDWNGYRIYVIAALERFSRRERMTCLHVGVCVCADITFGYKLKGEPAIESLNLPLSVAHVTTTKTRGNEERRREGRERL